MQSSLYCEGMPIANILLYILITHTNNFYLIALGNRRKDKGFDRNDS